MEFNWLKVNSLLNHWLELQLLPHRTKSAKLITFSNSQNFAPLPPPFPNSAAFRKLKGLFLITLSCFMLRTSSFSEAEDLLPLCPASCDFSPALTPLKLDLTRHVTIYATCAFSAFCLWFPLWTSLWKFIDLLIISFWAIIIINHRRLHCGYSEVDNHERKFNTW